MDFGKSIKRTLIANSLNFLAQDHLPIGDIMSQDNGEKPAVKTTIVGGRPPGSGKNMDAVPRGIEILIKKAAVDASFRKTLLDDPIYAAEAIDLKLQDAEAAVLKSIPNTTLDRMIASTKVQPKIRQAFMGYTAAVMLAALTATTPGLSQDTTTNDTNKAEYKKGISRGATTGIRADNPILKPPLSFEELVAKDHKIDTYMRIAPHDENALKGNLAIHIENWQRAHFGFVKIHLIKIESTDSAKENATEGSGYASKGLFIQNNIPAGEYLVEAGFANGPFVRAKKIIIREKETATLYFKVKEYNPDEGKPVGSLGILTDIE
jgi:hypothetical protein